MLVSRISDITDQVFTSYSRLSWRYNTSTSWLSPSFRVVGKRVNATLSSPRHCAFIAPHYHWDHSRSFSNYASDGNQAILSIVDPSSLISESVAFDPMASFIYKEELSRSG